MIEYLFQVTIYLLLKMFAVVTFSPIFLIPSIMISIAGAFLGDIMVKAQLCVKREMGRTKAPVLGHFGAAIGGIGECYCYFRGCRNLRCFFKLNSVHPSVWKTSTIQGRVDEAYR